MSSRAKLVAAFLALVAVSVGLGAAGNEWIRSPSQQVADTDPVEASPITVAVETGTLRHVVRSPGVVEWTDLVQLTLGGEPNGSEPVVTDKPVRPGSSVSVGDVVLEVADRPVILLRGRIPLLRDLKVGSEGADVRRLQEALSDAGFSITDREGFFSGSTAAALRSLYEARGYEPPTAAAEVPDTDEPDADEAGSTAQTSPSVVALRSELLFVPTLPTQLVAAGGAVGELVADPAIILSAVGPSIVTSMNPADADELRVGARVRVVGADGKVRSKGVVARKGPAAAVDGGGFRVAVSVRPLRDWSLREVGAKVDVEVELGGDAPPGLLVPLVAVASDADGENYVATLEDGKLEKVKVEVVDTADGRALLRPNRELSRGDMVLVSGAREP